MKIRPMSDRVVVRRRKEEDITVGGIVIPDNAKEKSQRGEVIAIGLGKRLKNGDNKTPDVKVGDEVLFSQYGGTEVKLDGKEVVILREDDILAVIG